MTGNAERTSLLQLTSVAYKLTPESRIKNQSSIVRARIHNNSFSS
jgi:hypothetical protein